MTLAKVVHGISCFWRKMWGRKMRVERAVPAQPSLLG